MDPKFNNNNHLIEDLKNDDKLENEVEKAVSNYRREKDPLKEKMMKNLLKIAVATIAIVIILFILSIITSGKRSYANVEEIMNKAAQKYYSENKSQLPKTTSQTVEVSAQKLANQNYMRDLSSYIKGSTCTGKVVVENNDDDYIYISYLDCGEKYKTTELFRKITSEENIETTSDGLYESNGEYIFRGEKVNNYLSLDEQLWRIVKVNRDNEVLLIKESKYDQTKPWDDRYNQEKNYNSGINDFNVSRIKDNLETICNQKEEKNKIFSEKTKSYIVKHNFCTGKRSKNSEGKDNSIECSMTSDKMKVGLLTVSEYMNASLDNSCTTASSISCQNYNYLVNHSMDWWLITSSMDNSYESFYVATSGIIKLSSSAGYRALRPAIYLNSKVMYKEGDGSLENPYKIK